VVGIEPDGEETVLGVPDGVMAPACPGGEIGCDVDVGLGVGEEIGRDVAVGVGAGDELAPLGVGDVHDEEDIVPYMLRMACTCDTPGAVAGHEPNAWGKNASVLVLASSR
jgi:hypothetical protein